MGQLAFKTLGGNGPDLLLLHGYGSDRLSWAGNAAALMTAARVHALDLPGHGESPAPQGDGSPQDLARDVMAALDAQGLGEVHLVGHSLGGGIAMLMALASLERVRSLTLIAPAGLGSGIDHGFLAQFADVTTPEETMALLQRLVSRPQLINRFTVARVLEQLAKPGARDALRMIAEGVMAHEADLDAAARQVAAAGIPRLVIFGAADAINPPDTAKLAAFGGRSLVIEAAGHLPHIEAPRPVNEAVTAFLASGEA